MARDPNELKYPESWKDAPDDLKKLPKPPGVPDAELYGGQWYANIKVYQNGRRVVQWYKRNTGTPNAPTPDDPVQTTTEDVVPTVKEEWDKEEDKPAPTVSAPPSQPSIVTRDPLTGELIATPNPNYQPTTNQKPTIGRVEGTPTGRTNPDGTPEYDNSRPIWVERDPNTNQQIGPAKPLTKEQRDQWEREKNGGKTDAEIRAEGETATAEAPVPNRPGWVQITTKTGNTTKVQFRGPDNKVVDTLPAESAKPQPVQQPDGSWGYWDTQPGQAPTWVPIQGGPGAETKPVQINGVYGVWKPGKDGAAPTFEPIANQPGRATLPPDAPKVDLSSAEAAHRTYMELLSYVDQKVRSGEWTAEQGKSVLEIPDSQVRSVISREKDQLTQANNVRDARLAQSRDQENRRVNDARMASDMFQQASNAAGAPGKLRGDLTPEYMILQARNNQAMGAYNRPPEIDIPAIGITSRPPAVAASAPSTPSAVAPPNAIGLPTTPPFVQPTGAQVEAANQQTQGTFQNAVGPLLKPPPVNPAAGDPGHNPNAPVGWSAPSEEPPAVAAVGTYQGPSSVQERAQQLKQEGFSDAEVDEALRRILARYGATV
jgi:hypothetical protein